MPDRTPSPEADDLIERLKGQVVVHPWEVDLDRCERDERGLLLLGTDELRLEAAAEIERLRGAIAAEIAWHDAEARRHHEAQNDAADAGDIEEAVLNKYEARAHETAAERLAAILKPTEADDDIAF